MPARRAPTSSSTCRGWASCARRTPASQASSGELLAFSDANVTWEPGALAALAAAFDDPAVDYACGQLRFVQSASGPGADNQEGVYWRYEMAVREAESRLRSITAGNGGIYAVRRGSYIVYADDRMDHDLAFPFGMVKRGRRAVYVPDARASEKMVPSIAGEFARKRRMMGYVWTIVLRSGMLAPRGYGLRYGWMILSHRVLRYCAPALHVAGPRRQRRDRRDLAEPALRRLPGRAGGAGRGGAGGRRAGARGRSCSRDTTST